MLREGFELDTDSSGDGQILINSIKNGVTPNWRIQRILMDIMDALNKFPNYEVKHVFREVNKAGDYMANMGTTLRTKEEQIFDAIPSDDLKQILEDYYDTSCRWKKEGIG
ncbi:hypothetical protein SUGI_0730220 [Cryptomeria japonica]|nr:hypothetical protein SUGI_0730220 [Cryptomeria japonica]